MIQGLVARAELPHVEVLVQSSDRSLAPASTVLADDVIGDLATTRRLIINEFGENGLTSLPIDEVLEVGAYFSGKKWSLPEVVLIDPLTDALRLEELLRRSKFRSISDERFFTGSGGAVISPGGSAQRDLVILHNKYSEYRQEAKDLVTG